MSNIWLIRHGDTEWSVARRHTGRTDLPLNPSGERQAAALRQRLEGHAFSLVLCSPLRRARETCAIAGLGAKALVDDHLMEWNYGIYEGRTTTQIRAEDPNWDIWSATITNGESVDEVGARTERVIDRVENEPGDVAIFAHAHVMRILAARWMGMEAAAGRFFALDTASVSMLGHEREHRVIERWNDVSHLPKMSNA